MEKHFLDQVKWGVIPIISYRGVLVTKTTDGYSVLRQNATTPTQVDTIISNAELAAQNSIKRGNKVSEIY